MENYKDNYTTSFLADLEVGTPAQRINIWLDTKAGDLVLMSEDNPYCGVAVEQLGGTDMVNCSEAFDYRESSSWDTNSTLGQKELMTVGGGEFTLRYGHDTVTVGNVTLDRATIALNVESNVTLYMLGVGPVATETSIDWDDYEENRTWPPKGSYDNLLAQLKSQGVIGRVAYSLWINGDTTGSILFGGVDHAKYDGQLQMLPIPRTAYAERYDIDQPMGPYIILSSITAVGTDASVDVLSNAALMVQIDSTAEYSVLPTDVIDALVESLGGHNVPDPSIKYYYSVHCDLDGAGSFRFNFCGAEIAVPVGNFLVPWEDESGEPVMEDGHQLCDIAISSGSQYTLGHSFLKAAYIVFDYESNEIGLAQAKTGSNATTASIAAMTSGVPSATQAASYSSSTSRDDYATSASQVIHAESTSTSASEDSSGATSLCPGALAAFFVCLLAF